MSEIKNIIEITPPSHLGYSNAGEVILMANIQCTRCSGSGGWHIDSFDPAYNVDVGEYDKVCTLCLGTGIIKPTVVVRWASSGAVKDRFKDCDHEE